MTKSMSTSTLKGMVMAALCALLPGSFLSISVANAAEKGLQAANIRLDDIASMQRGARLFFNYCSGCHSLEYLRYSRIGKDLKIDPADVEKNFVFTGGKIGDHAVSHMPADDAATWFGKTPPDLSLEARAKGSDWIYSYLKSFYIDPTRPLGWNNTVFENASMPNALWELQGIQVAVVKPAEEGQDATIEKLEIKTPGRQDAAAFDRTVRDITAFLQYAGEPAALKRQSMGVWVLLYIAFFTLLAWLLKHEFWKDVH